MKITTELNISSILGLDIGGSLTKLVFFELIDPHLIKVEKKANRIFRDYILSQTVYEGIAVRDKHLQLNDVKLHGNNGNLHFIRFPTCRMSTFLDLVKKKCISSMITALNATGGGAYKFEFDFLKKLKLPFHKLDELQCLISGIHLVDKMNSQSECYFYENPLGSNCIQRSYDFSHPYPYIVVNIGSGVSILLVKSSNDFTRISGSSLGGGTFLGLCCLLTGCKTFDEAIRLAEEGKNETVDKLVKDIYGGSYDRFNLPAEAVASSFGHMMHPERNQNVSIADLARATLTTITNNIGSIAILSAKSNDIQQVVFVGNFLRVNKLSMKLLSYAMDFWSKGQTKALFLKHEGYFGAVGSLQEFVQT